METIDILNIQFFCFICYVYYNGNSYKQCKVSYDNYKKQSKSKNKNFRNKYKYLKCIQIYIETTNGFTYMSTMWKKF